MSDITPADALRELGDDQAEYAAAAAKKQTQAAERDLASIRERWEWRVGGCPEPAPVPANRAKDDDIEWLLAEVARRDKVLEEVRAMAARWVTLSRQAMDQDVREWASAAGHSVLGVLNRAALNTSSTQESP